MSKTHVSEGLYVSIYIVAVCFGIVCRAIYILLQPSGSKSFSRIYPTNNEVSTTAAGSAGGFTILTGSSPYALEDSISATMYGLIENHHAYLSDRQHQQNNTTFHPEGDVKRYFKEFYGDTSILSK